jgi:hypothetical protein
LDGKTVAEIQASLSWVGEHPTEESRQGIPTEESDAHLLNYLGFIGHLSPKSQQLMQRRWTIEIPDRVHQAHERELIDTGPAHPEIILAGMAATRLILEKSRKHRPPYSELL